MSITGSIVRASINDKLGERVSILDFGCPTDNVSDCSSAMATALANISGFANGGIELYFPGGRTYNFTNSIFFSGLSNIRITGDSNSTVFQRSGTITSGQGLFDLSSCSNIQFKSILVDGATTSPVGINYSSLTTPYTNTLTGNTSFWVHGGCSQILFDDVHVQHTGGYSILIDSRFTGDIKNVRILNSRFANNRPFTFGPTGDLNYGAWTGGILVLADGSSATYNIQDLLVSGCHFSAITGHAFWTHTIGSARLLSGIKVVNSHFKDIGLDGVQFANVDGGGVYSNHFRRIGYIVLTDGGSSTPKWINTTPAPCAIDTAGYTLNCEYNGNTITNCNGTAIDLDGFGHGTVHDNTAEVSVSGDAAYTEDSVASWTIQGKGINGNNSNNTVWGGSDISVMGNVLINLGTGAVNAYSFRNCKVAENTIDHPSAPTSPPITVANVGSGSNQRAYNNTIGRNHIKYSPSTPQPCVYEYQNGFSFSGGDINWFLPNTIYGNGNAIDFSKDSTSGSTGTIPLSTVDPHPATKSVALLQREGVGLTSALKVYSDIGAGGIQVSSLAHQVGTGIRLVTVTSGGSGYAGTTTVSFSGGGGSGLAGYPVISGGVISQIVITNWGTGYTSAPSYSFASTGGGSGAALSFTLMNSPLLNISAGGAAGSGCITTGNRTSSIFEDGVFCGAVSADGFMMLSDSSYNDSIANSVPSGVCLFRAHASTGAPEWSMSFSSGVRVWNTFGTGGGGGGGSPGGVTGSIQYNASGGGFGGDSKFLYDNVNNVLSIGNGATALSHFFALGARAYLTCNVTDPGGTPALDDSTKSGLWLATVPGTSASASVWEWLYTPPGATSIAILSAVNGLGNWCLGGPIPSSTAGQNLIVQGGAGVAAVTISAGGLTLNDSAGSGNLIYAPNGGITCATGTFGPASGSVAVNQINIQSGGLQCGNLNSQNAAGITIIKNNDVAGGSGSARAQILFGNWQVGQDRSGNGTKDFFFLNPSGVTTFGMHASLGNVGINTSASATTGQILTVAGTSGVAGINLTGGYIQCAQGVFVPASGSGGTDSYQAIHLNTGGSWARSHFSQVYTQLGANSGVPTATTGDSVTTNGCIYYDNTLHSIQAYVNGAWTTLATASGGVTSLNALTGALSVVGTASQITVSAAGSSVTLSLPNNVVINGTSGTAGLTVSNGYIQSSSAGFFVNDSSGSNVYNAVHVPYGGVSCGIGSNGGFYVGSTKVIDTSANSNFNTMTSFSALITSGCQSAGFSVKVGASVYTGASVSGKTVVVTYSDGTTSNQNLKGGILC